MSSVAIGDLRHRITIERPLRIDDEGGAARLSWQVVALVWAKVEQLGGTEPVRADTAVAQASVRITLRYRNDIDATMRIVRGDDVFEIVAVADADGLGRWLVCTCRAIGP